MRTMVAALRTASAVGILGEADVNLMGYELLFADQVELALAVFQVNVQDHQSFNVHDSLGENDMKAGQNELAIRSYRKSLELDSTNDNATKMIAPMMQGQL